MSFQPICVVCLGDCNRDGGVTSCNHYLCSRCVSRLPAAAPCPLCQQPYQLVTLDHPNVQQLLQDGATVLGRTEKVIVSQVRHYQQVIHRMRQALAMLHGQNQDMARQSQRKQAECAAAVSQAQALQEEVCRLREELAHATTAATCAYSQRKTSQQQSQPPPPQQQQRAHMLADPRVTHASGGYSHGAPKTVEVCQTPAGQIIPPPLAGRHAPFLPAGVVGARASDTSPRGSWPRPSVTSSPSPSSHSHGQHRGHHSHGNGGESRGAAASETSASSAVGAAPPLGWSASSLIAKRHRSDSNPSLPRRRVDDIRASLPQPAASVGAGAKVALTPRTHATVSPQQRPPHQSSHAFAHQSGSGGGDSPGPSIDFWLTTPLAAAAQQQSRRPDSFMPAGTSYMPRSSSKPLQRLFSSPRDGPRSF
ncbi:conserved hypothetical protein [Leishmania major strain Friedlin]|uniref:RING-type domain-containing protein n=1 Tax=Leishmania major TaxID=5664 RepID=Q4QGD1_LEIMA|nr:conserved hypothetical protein [Leishmania major strain Friedlin]CAG9570901.1 hypothetical_protein_-_conserved [Leishmania major strain Friedlin]CAJ02479.1 conserved hypothetical protein [Leishmania major strain Friedlin]|eukprot:XP_001681767.1 conserved hypothetical protein [Leishmania major strain Friedlin]